MNKITRTISYHPLFVEFEELTNLNAKQSAKFFGVTSVHYGNMKRGVSPVTEAFQNSLEAHLLLEEDVLRALLEKRLASKE